MLEEELNQKLTEDGNIIASIVSEDECRFGHHGYCQEHFFLQDGECSHSIAQKWLSKNRPELWSEIVG